MAIRRRTGSTYWHYDFAVNGIRFRGSTATEDRATAEIIEAKLRSDVLLNAVVGKKPDITLNEALARHWLEHGSELRSATRVMQIGRLLIKIIGKPTLLSSITTGTISEYIAKRRGAGVANATVNRELAVLRAVLRRAERRWEVAVGMVDWQTLRLREPPPPERYLTPEEAGQLIDAAAEHLKQIIKFALLTGARRENILSLDWSQVDLPSRQIAFQVKSATTGTKPHVIPVSTPLLALLASLGPQDAGAVFTYSPIRKGGWLMPPRPVADIKTAFKAAVRRAGIPVLRFHDLRHTAASWMVQEGVPLDTVRDVLGHSSIAVTVRYAHRGAGAKRDAVETLGSRLCHSDDPTQTQAIERK